MEELGRCPFCGAPFVKETKDGVTTVYCPSCGFIKEEYEELYGGPQEKSYNLEEYLLRKRTDKPQKRYDGDLNYLNVKVRKTQKLLRDILSKIKRYYDNDGRKNMGYVVEIIEKTVLDEKFLRNFFLTAHRRNSNKVLKILIYKELLRLDTSKGDNIILKKMIFGRGYYYRLRVMSYNWPRNLLPYIERMRRKIEDFKSGNLLVVRDFLKFMRSEVKKLVEHLDKNNVYRGLLEVLMEENIEKEILEIARSIDLRDTNIKNTLLLAILGRLIPFYTSHYVSKSKLIRPYSFFKTFSQSICEVVQKVISKYLGISKNKLIRDVEVYVQSFIKCGNMSIIRTSNFAYLQNPHRLILFYSLLKKYRGYNKSFSEYLKELEEIVSIRSGDKRFKLTLSKYMSLKNCPYYPLPL